MSTEEGRPEVPILQTEFADHLRKYRIKQEMVDTIAENIAEVGGPTVFEDPELLNPHLASWSQWVGATLRRQILDHWFAKKGINLIRELGQVKPFNDLNAGVSAASPSTRQSAFLN